MKVNIIFYKALHISIYQLNSDFSNVVTNTIECGGGQRKIVCGFKPSFIAYCRIKLPVGIGRVAVIYDAKYSTTQWWEANDQAYHSIGEGYLLSIDNDGFTVSNNANYSGTTVRYVAVK